MQKATAKAKGDTARAAGKGKGHEKGEGTGRMQGEVHTVGTW